MKIPESVRIGGVEYSVTYEENLRHGNDIAYGHISYDDCLIQLSSTDGTSPQMRGQILWHEILHGISEHANLKIEDEENVIDTLAKGIYQVLQDNGRRLFDIVPETEIYKTEGEKKDEL